MGNILEYNGYHSKIEYCAEDNLLHGKIEGINDLVTFESADINTIKDEFHSAVDDYLEFCQMVGKDPEKEYKGSFNVRISPNLHKQLAVFAFSKGESLNSIVEKAIDHYLSEDHNHSIYYQMQQSMTIVANALQNVTSAQFDKTNNNHGSNIIPFNYASIKCREA